MAGEEKPTNHFNLHQILPSNAIIAAKPVVQRLDFTVTGYAVLKNDLNQGAVTIVKHDRRLPTTLMQMKTKLLNYSMCE